MKPQEVVMAFAERVITCSLALREEFDGASREDPRSPLSLVTSLDRHRVRER